VDHKKASNAISLLCRLGIDLSECLLNEYAAFRRTGGPISAQGNSNTPTPPMPTSLAASSPCTSFTQSSLLGPAGGGTADRSSLAAVEDEEENEEGLSGRLL